MLYRRKSAQVYIDMPEQRVSKERIFTLWLTPIHWTHNRLEPVRLTPQGLGFWRPTDTGPKTGYIWQSKSCPATRVPTVFSNHSFVVRLQENWLCPAFLTLRWPESHQPGPVRRTRQVGTTSARLPSHTTEPEVAHYDTPHTNKMGSV